jgi:cobalt-zinc-cadmium resistance protein CzcA
MGGGVIALFVSGQPLSVSSIVGFISLFGVSVMNGILIITYYNQVKSTGGQRGLEAMAHAAEQRMRPLLMTSLAACIGLLPSALSTGIGSQVQRPLASVVVGGMFIGPVLLLLIVPALQMMFLRDDDHARNDAARTHE